MVTESLRHMTAMCRRGKEVFYESSEMALQSEGTCATDPDTRVQSLRPTAKLEVGTGRSILGLPTSLVYKHTQTHIHRERFYKFSPPLN